MPILVMNLGSGILIAAAVSVFLFSERLFYAWNTPTILFALGAAVAVTAFPLIRFEVVTGELE